MADRTALGRIGMMLGAATMMVMTIGTLVVTDHLTGRLQIDDGLANRKPAGNRPLMQNKLAEAGKSFGRSGLEGRG